MLKFAPIMPAFCSLRFPSHYSKNFAGKIDASLITVNLEWRLLSKHRHYSRLTLFFKFLHQNPPVIRIPQHYLPSTLTHYTQHTQHLHYIPSSTSTTYFQKSFSPGLIWIIYQTTLLKETQLDHFTLYLKPYDYNWLSLKAGPNIITL